MAPFGAVPTTSGRKELWMNEQAEKAFKEMLDISTDLDKAVLFRGEQVEASNFPETLRGAMVAKAQELAKLGDQHATDMGSSPLTQLMVETGAGMVFLVREAGAGGMGVLATGKKDSRIGLVFYDMKTCIRDAQEEETGDVVIPSAEPTPAPEAEPSTDAGTQGEEVTE